jgi:hypothetical protein
MKNETLCIISAVSLLALAAVIEYAPAFSGIERWMNRNPVWMLGILAVCLIPFGIGLYRQVITPILVNRKEV